MKFFRIAIAVLALSLVAFAQYTYPTGPNTGKANTPYSVSAFSATFNGVVKVDTYRSADNQSSNTTYISQNVNVAEMVVVRTIEHDIAVDYTSSDFYANDDSTGGTLDPQYTTRNVWGGHPYTYTYRTFTLEGTVLTKRVRYIIVNARTAVFIEQISLASYDDRDEWLDFEYSLRIN